jgi:hypothetical protein
MKLINIDVVTLFGNRFTNPSGNNNYINNANFNILTSFDDLFSDDNFFQKTNIKEFTPHPFLNNYKRMWSDNNDYLSFHYKDQSESEENSNFKQKCLEIFLQKFNIKMNICKYNFLTK